MKNRKAMADHYNMPAGGKSRNNRRLCRRRMNKLARRLDRAAINAD